MSERQSNGADVDHPPYSRLFVACGKLHTEECLRAAFSKFGDIDSLYVLKDGQTKESRGIAYVKYQLTSAAALAQEKLDKNTIGDDPKAVRVCIATSKYQQKSFDVNDTSSRNRLYVIVPKGASEQDLEDTFSHFAEYESSYVIRDKSSAEQHKGFGFVCFSKASSAALAMENCNNAYHAVIAEPRDATRSRRAAGDLTPHLQHGMRPVDRMSTPAVPPLMPTSQAGFPLHSAPSPTRLYVKVDPSITPEQLSRLCDLPPGLADCRLMHSNRSGESRGFAFVTYHSVEAAVYAKDKLQNLEYPPGFFITVKFAEDPPKSLDQSYSGHSIGESAAAAPVAEHDPRARVFFVCTPSAPPIPTLRTLFSQYGNIERLWLVGDHNYGYGVFTEPAAASLVADRLNGTESGGCRLKVVLADPPRET